MASIDLKGVHIVHSKGRVYAYAWRGGPRIKAPVGTPEFVKEYVDLTAAKKAPAKGTIKALVLAWQQTKKWTEPYERGGMSDSTKVNWQRWVAEIEAEFGQLKVRRFDDPEIRKAIRRWRGKWQETPRAADVAKTVLSALLSYAVEEGMLSTNPCFGVPNLYEKADRSDVIWTPDDVKAFCNVASKELAWALRLACLTGLRQADLLQLSWSNVKPTTIERATGKSGNKRTAVIPIYPELRELLDEIPKRSTIILTNQDAAPWKGGFRSSFGKAKEKAGVGHLHFHDARGTFATRAYVAGFKPREIAQILAWSEDKVDAILDRYVRKDEVIADLVKRLSENDPGTESVKPGVKPT